MGIDSLKLDYYTDFLGENEIRFYAYPDSILFKKKFIEFDNEKFIEIQLTQGENGIYFFSFWDGYFNTIMKELIDFTQNYNDLPQFIKNWNECKGWCSLDSQSELISATDIDCLFENLIILNEKMNKDIAKGLWDINCVTDFILFLDFVKSNNWKLCIREE